MIIINHNPLDCEKDDLSEEIFEFKEYIEQIDLSEKIKECVESSDLSPVEKKYVYTYSLWPYPVESIRKLHNLFRRMILSR